MSKKNKLGCIIPLIYIIILIFLISTCNRNSGKDESFIKRAAITSKSWYDDIKSVWASEVLSVYNAKDSINNE